MPNAGEPHPRYPGCVWSPEIETYVCDDGSTVDGDPYFVIANQDNRSSGNENLLLYGGLGIAAILLIAIISKK